MRHFIYDITSHYYFSFFFLDIVKLCAILQEMIGSFTCFLLIQSLLSDRVKEEVLEILGQLGKHSPPTLSCTLEQNTKTNVYEQLV